jgi:mRNA interferase RelE/StbE
MSRPHRVEFAPPAADAVRSLPPEIKRQIRSALRALAVDPGIDVPLLRELDGLYKYRVRRFRIVYEISVRARMIRVVAVGHRRSIYDDLAAARDPAPDT